MSDIMINQRQIFDHFNLLQHDLAYKWSVENDSPQNMQIVLRAYGLPHTWADAENQLKVAKTI